LESLIQNLPAGTRISCVVSADSCIRPGKFERDSHRVMVLIRFEKKDRYSGDIKFGKKIEIHGTLEPFPFQRNPGEFDYGSYLALNDIQGVVTVKGLDHVRVSGKSDNNSCNPGRMQRSKHCITSSIVSILHAMPVS